MVSNPALCAGFLWKDTLAYPLSVFDKNSTFTCFLEFFFCFQEQYPCRLNPSMAQPGKIAKKECHQTIGRGECHSMTLPYLHRPHDSGPIQWALGDVGLKPPAAACPWTLVYCEWRAAAPGPLRLPRAPHLCDPEAAVGELGGDASTPSSACIAFRDWLPFGRPELILAEEISSSFIPRGFQITVLYPISRSGPGTGSQSHPHRDRVHGKCHCTHNPTACRAPWPAS